MRTDAPIYGQTYALTGTKDQPSIMRGDSWEASRLTKPAAFTSGTRIYKNHYGLIAESVFGNTLFTTMRRYNRDTVTSISTIEKNEGGTMISHPENVSYTHLFTGTLTKKRLAGLHQDGITRLTKQLANLA